MMCSVFASVSLTSSPVSQERRRDLSPAEEAWCFSGLEQSLFHYGSSEAFNDILFLPCDITQCLKCVCVKFASVWQPGETKIVRACRQFFSFLLIANTDFYCKCKYFLRLSWLQFIWFNCCVMNRVDQLSGFFFSQLTERCLFFLV